MSAQKFIFTATHEGKVNLITGCRHVDKIDPSQTGGAFGAIEIEVPVDCGPPMHHHRSDAEWFYLLSGSITFTHAEGSVRAYAGDSVYLPAGQGHAFRNEGTVPAKALRICSPGIEAHEFFAEMGAKLHGRIDVPVMTDIATRNGIGFGLPAAAELHTVPQLL